MGIKFSDNALTTLYQAIGVGDVVLQVAPTKGDNFPAVTGGLGDYFVVTMEDASGNREFIRCDNRLSGSDTMGSASFPLTRAYWGSTARAWSAGDSVDLRVSANALAELSSGVLTADEAFINALIWG